MKYTFFFLLFCQTAFGNTNPFATLNDTESINTLPPLFSQRLRYGCHDATLKALQPLITDQDQPQPRLFCDQLTNQLFAHLSLRQQHQLQLILKKIDIAPQQIIIRATIITIDRHYLHHLGLDFNSNNTNSSHANNLNFPLITLNNNNMINLRLHLLEKQGHATVIAAPILFTVNQHAASIAAGTAIPYQQTTASGATTTKFKNAMLKLNVTPYLQPNQHILLHIDINHDSVSPLQIKGEPAIKTQHITTQVQLMNHHTVVIGGIINQVHAQHQQGIPGAQSIPLIGHLFHSQQQQNHDSELFILIQPTIAPADAPPRK